MPFIEYIRIIADDLKFIQTVIRNIKKILRNIRLKLTV